MADAPANIILINDNQLQAGATFAASSGSDVTLGV